MTIIPGKLIIFFFKMDDQAEFVRISSYLTRKTNSLITENDPTIR